MGGQDVNPELTDLQNAIHLTIEVIRAECGAMDAPRDVRLLAHATLLEQVLAGQEASDVR